MADKLSIYNRALGYCRERKIASLSVNEESRLVMDTYWDDAIAYALEQGFWKFALKTEQIYSNSGYTAPFGFTFQFTIPSDWTHTYQMSASDRFDPALTEEQCQEEGGRWYADIDPLYVRYVSNAADYGGDLSAYSETYTDFVASRLAYLAAPKITDSSELTQLLEKREKTARIRARANDAMNSNPAFARSGTWARSRRGFTPADKARGTLIG